MVTLSSFLPQARSLASDHCSASGSSRTSLFLFPVNTKNIVTTSSTPAFESHPPAPILSLRTCSSSASSGCSTGSFCATLLASSRHSVKSCCLASTATSIPEAYGVTESGKFSISDEDMQTRGFQLRRTMDNIDLDQLNSLFVKVGFPRRQKEKLHRALQHTSSLLWLEEAKSEKLIAFARATGDDVFNAIIWDVVVDPSYQGLGLGKAVLERLMVDLVRKGISNISLYAEPNVVGFYKPLGYIADPHGIKAMAYSRKGR